MLELPEGLQSLITQLFHVVSMYTFHHYVFLSIWGECFWGQRGFKKKQPTDVFQDGSPQIPSEEKATAQLAGKPEAAETNMGTPGDISRPFLVKIWWRRSQFSYQKQIWEIYQVEKIQI